MYGAGSRQHNTTQHSASQYSTAPGLDAAHRGSHLLYASRQLSSDLSRTPRTVIIHEGMPILGLSPSPMILFIFIFLISPFFSFSSSLSRYDPNPEDQTEIFLSKKVRTNPHLPPLLSHGENRYPSSRQRFAEWYLGRRRDLLRVVAQ